MNDERIHIDTHSILGWAGRGAWLKILLGFSSLVGDSCSIAFTSCPNTLRQAYRPLLLFIILFEGIHIRNRMFISVLNKREVKTKPSNFCFKISYYCPSGYVDDLDPTTGTLIPGTWRQHYNNDLLTLRRQGTNNFSMEAKRVRHQFNLYFNTVGAVSWQEHGTLYC